MSRQRFKRAIDRATKPHLARASKEERDEWDRNFANMKPDVVAAMTLPVFSTKFNVPSLQEDLQLAVRCRSARSHRTCGR